MQFTVMKSEFSPEPFGCTARFLDQYATFSYSTSYPACVVFRVTILVQNTTSVIERARTATLIHCLVTGAVVTSIHEPIKYSPPPPKDYFLHRGNKKQARDHGPYKAQLPRAELCSDPKSGPRT